MPLVTITNLQDVWVNVKVRESAINQFKVGNKVPIQVIGVPQKAYDGFVTYIAAKPSYATERAIQEKGEKDMVAFEVKIKLDNSRFIVKTGDDCDCCFKSLRVIPQQEFNKGLRLIIDP